MKKKNWSRTLSLLLAVALVAGLLVVPAAAAGPTAGTYTLNADEIHQWLKTNKPSGFDNNGDKYTNPDSNNPETWEQIPMTKGALATDDLNVDIVIKKGQNGVDKSSKNFTAGADYGDDAPGKIDHRLKFGGTMDKSQSHIKFTVGDKAEIKVWTYYNKANCYAAIKDENATKEIDKGVAPGDGQLAVDALYVPEGGTYLLGFEGGGASNLYAIQIKLGVEKPKTDELTVAPEAAVLDNVTKTAEFAATVEGYEGATLYAAADTGADLVSVKAQEKTITVTPGTGTGTATIVAAMSTSELANAEAIKAVEGYQTVTVYVDGEGSAVEGKEHNFESKTLHPVNPGAKSVPYQGDNYFTLVTTSATTYSTSSNKDWTGKDEGVNYKIDSTAVPRFSTGASVTQTGPGIQFTTEAAAKVKVWWVANGSNKNNVAIVDDSGTEKAASEEATTTANEPYYSALDLTDPGTYLVGGKEGNPYIFKVVVTEEEAAAKTSLNGKTVTIKKGAEALGETAPVVGDVLTAEVSDKVSSNAVDFTWTVGETQVAGNTTNTYTVKAADIGKVIKVKAAAKSDSDYTGETDEAQTQAVVGKTIEVEKVTVTGTEAVAYDGQAHGITVTVDLSIAGAKVTYGDSAEACTAETSPTITNVADSPKKVYYKVTAPGYTDYTGSATITINKAAAPTITLSIVPDQVASTGGDVKFTIHGVPGEVNPSLTCDPDGEIKVELNQEEDGDYTGTYTVKANDDGAEKTHTISVVWAGDGNYNALAEKSVSKTIKQLAQGAVAPQAPTGLEIHTADLAKMGITAEVETHSSIVEYTVDEAKLLAAWADPATKGQLEALKHTASDGDYLYFCFTFEIPDTVDTATYKVAQQINGGEIGAKHALDNTDEFNVWDKGEKKILGDWFGFAKVDGDTLTVLDTKEWNHVNYLFYENDDAATAKAIIQLNVKRQDPVKAATVTVDGANLDASRTTVNGAAYTAATKVSPADALTVVVAAADGAELPDTIEVKKNGNAMAAGDYTWTKASGTLTIAAGKFASEEAITVTVNAGKKISVVAAPLGEGADDQGYTVTGEGIEGGTVAVTISATSLTKHKGGADTEDYWVGFGMPIDGNASDYTYTVVEGTNAATEVAGPKTRTITDAAGKTYATIYLTANKDGADANAYTVKQTKGATTTTYNVTINVTKRVDPARPAPTTHTVIFYATWGSISKAENTENFGDTCFGGNNEAGATSFPWVKALVEDGQALGTAIPKVTPRDGWTFLGWTDNPVEVTEATITYKYANGAYTPDLSTFRPTGEDDIKFYAVYRDPKGATCYGDENDDYGSGGTTEPETKVLATWAAADHATEESIKQEDTAEVLIHTVAGVIELWGGGRNPAKTDENYNEYKYLPDTDFEEGKYLQGTQDPKTSDNKAVSATDLPGVGSYYKFVPKIDGKLTVKYATLSGSKPIFIMDVNGETKTTLEGTGTTSKKEAITIEIDAKVGHTYWFYLSGSKIGLISYTFASDQTPVVEKVTVTYQLDFGADAPANPPAAPEAVKIDAGSTVTELPPAPAAEGYTFDKWYLGEAEFTTATVVNEDITVVGKYTKNSAAPETTYALVGAVTPENSGTVTFTVGGAAATSAKADDVVTVVATPATGYQLKSLAAVQTGTTTAVTIGTNNTFTMPAAGVTVTATFEATSTPGVDKSALNQKLEEANALNESVEWEADDASEVPMGTQFVSEKVATDFEAAIAAAKEVAEDPNATQDAVTQAEQALAEAIKTFSENIQEGTADPAECLKNDIAEAKKYLDDVVESTDGNDVAQDKLWAKKEARDALSNAIKAAEDVLNKADVTDDELLDAIMDLAKALATFEENVDNGYKTSGSSSGGYRPGSTVSGGNTTSNPSTTTTETQTDGSTVTTTEDSKGNTTVVTTRPDGLTTTTETTADGDVTIKTVDKDNNVLAEVSIPANLGEPDEKFVDVPEGHWAEKAINEMAALNLVEGVDSVNHIFDMTSPVTRGAVATILFRFSNGQEGIDQNFTDVADNAWYTDAVAWASTVGVVTGFENGTFQPDGSITREQLAAMIYRFARLIGLDVTAKSDLTAFTDGVNVQGWAVDGVAWCVAEGIINGRGNGELDTTAAATRAEAAAMLDRFVSLLK